MPADSNALLELIAVADAPATQDVDIDDALKRSIDLLSRINGTHESFKRSLFAVALRTVEMALLSDRELLNLARFWETRLGEAPRLVAERLEHLLGQPAPASLVKHALRCLGSPVCRAGRGRRLHERNARALIERCVNKHASRQLRCYICGYHFRRDDLESLRLSFAESVDAKFAAELHPRRQVDFLKPTRFGEGRRSATTLTIDHVVPEYGMGSPDLENLAIVCQFCNGGKLIYRAPLEPVSVAVAAFSKPAQHSARA